MIRFIHGHDGDWLLNMSMIESIYLDDRNSDRSHTVIKYKPLTEDETFYEKFGDFYEYELALKVYDNLIDDLNDGSICVINPRLE